METKINEKNKSEIEISCEMTWEEFKPYCDRAFELLSQGVKVKGFRLGKAPQDLLKKEISQEKINSLAAENAIKEKYPEIIKEKDIEPIGAPGLSVLKLAENNPFCFKATVFVLPEVDLPDYKKIAKETPKEKAVIDDKEFEQATKFLLRSRAKFEDLNRASQKGDFVHIEYQSSQVDNSRKVSDGFILGDGRLLPGFEKQLEGMKEGESKEFKETFPKDYQSPELAGKEVEFKVKMEKVQKMTAPLLDDEFAKSLGKFKTVDELKKNVREGITMEKQSSMAEKWRNKVLERILEETKIALPEVLVKTEQENAISELKAKVQEDLKISFEKYLEQVKKTEEGIKKDLLEQSELKLKSFLIVREIGRREKVTVNPQEIEQAVNSFFTSFPQNNKKGIAKESLEGYYREMIYNQKVFQKLESF